MQLHVFLQVEFYNDPPADGHRKGKSLLTMGIETIKPIKQGEAVLVDYAARFWAHTEDGDDDMLKVLLCALFT